MYDFDQTTVATLERSPKFKTKRNVTQNLTCTHAQLQQKPNSIQLYIMFLPSKLFEQNKTIYFLAKKLLTQGKGWKTINIVINTIFNKTEEEEKQEESVACKLMF